MAQGELCELLLKVETEGLDLTQALPQITLSVARLARASIPQKKWQSEVRERLATAADKAGQAAKKAGLSNKAVDAIRKEILGVGG